MTPPVETKLYCPMFREAAGTRFTNPILFNGRVTTNTLAGANIELDSTYLYGQLWEMRTKVTSFTGIGTDFVGYYWRAEVGVDAGSNNLQTTHMYAMLNGTYSIGNLQGLYVEAGMKAGGTQTVANAAAIEASLAPYTGTGAITVTNYMTTLLLTPSACSSRLDSTNAAKIHGIYLLARDGDGGSTKLGYGIYMGNDTGQSGTRTLTAGMKIAIGCTNGIDISGTCTENYVKLAGALTVGDNYSGVRVAVTAALPSNEYGLSGYFESTLSGTAAGHQYNLGSWINLGASYVSTAGKLIVPFEGGVYDGGATLTNARIVLCQLQAILSSAPASLSVFRVNTATRTVDALFAAASPESIGWVAGAGTAGTQVGYIPLANIVGPGKVYVRVYSSAT